MPPYPSNQKIKLEGLEFLENPLAISRATSTQLLFYPKKEKKWRGETTAVVSSKAETRIWLSYGPQDTRQ